MEFALVLPVLLTLLFAIITMGTVLYHYQLLIGATEAGCRYLAAARGTTTTPLASTVAAVKGYSGNLASAAVQVTVSIQNQPCASDANCLTLLNNGQGDPVSVRATYPCRIAIMGVDLAPNCNLVQQLTESVE